MYFWIELCLLISQRGDNVKRFWSNKSEVYSYIMRLTMSPQTKSTVKLAVWRPRKATIQYRSLSSAIQRTNSKGFTNSSCTAIKKECCKLLNSMLHEHYMSNVHIASNPNCDEQISMAILKKITATFFFFFRLLPFRGRHSGCFQTSTQKIWQCLRRMPFLTQSTDGREA